MNPRRLTIVLLAVAYAAIAATDESDPRTAKVMDRAGSQSRVSAINVSAVDDRFGFGWPDQEGRIVVATKNIEFAIPLRSVSVIDSAGSNTWIVKYQTKEGEASVSGDLPGPAHIKGDSDFGTFSLFVGNLKRLEFSQAGVAAKPAKRATIYAAGGKANDASFTAVLTLTDGTTLQAADLRRHAAFEIHGMDTAWIPAKPYTSAENRHFTDFVFHRGETIQNIPFEKIKTVDFTSGESVTVTTKTDAKAEMKLSQDSISKITGFTGTSSKGDFYVPAKFVKSIAFRDATK